ncbi:MAG: MFS transporter [Oscillospiraceae bacterium]|nr:MFS transporter [Oscillospiraceae bacterium]
MKTKLSSRFWVALTLFSLVGQVAWVVENMYFNVFIYKMFRASAADISAMVGASSVAATVTTVLIGAFSDRIGKRKLLICGGYLVWGVSILSFCLLRIDVIEAIFPMTANAMSLGVSLVIILDCVMTFFGSSANDAAFNAWVTDSTDHTNRGAVEGINSMMPLISILVVFGGFMGFDLNQSESWTMIFAIIGGVVICVGIAGLFLIDESNIKPTKTGYFENLCYGFRPSTARSNRALYIMLLVFALFNISIQTYMPYLILYYEVSLGMTNYVLIMAPAIILAAVVTAFWGKVYDRRGFRFAALMALAALNLGYIVLYLTRSTLPVFLGSLLMMSGYLSGMAVFGAYVRDFTPEGKSGQFQGLRIFSQVLIPGVIGPAIGAAVLRGAEQIVNSDGTTSFVPNANIFAAALAVGIAVTLCVIAVTKKRTAAK